MNFAKWHIVVRRPDSTFIDYPISKTGKIENMTLQRGPKRNIVELLKGLSRGDKSLAPRDSSQEGGNTTQDAPNKSTQEPISQPEEPIFQPEEPIFQPEEPIFQPEEPWWFDINPFFDEGFDTPFEFNLFDDMK